MCITKELNIITVSLHAYLHICTCTPTVKSWTVIYSYKNLKHKNIKVGISLCFAFVKIASNPVKIASNPAKIASNPVKIVSNPVSLLK